MNYVTMRIHIVAVISLTVALIPDCGAEASETDAYLSRFAADLWTEGADVVRIIWRDCSKKVRILPITLRC